MATAAMFADNTSLIDPSRWPEPTITAESSPTSSTSGYSSEGCADTSMKVSAPHFWPATTARSKRTVPQRLSYQYGAKSTSLPTSAPGAEPMKAIGPSPKVDVGSSSSGSGRRGGSALGGPG